MKQELKNKLKRLVVYGGLVGLGAFLLIFVTTNIFIGHSVVTRCQEAQAEYGGDCTTAMIAYLQDEESHTLRDRNHYIWALGQWGDEQALPVLEEYYTGEECHHDQDLCQYELEKAINLLEGGFNLSRLVWWPLKTSLTSSRWPIWF